MNWQQPKVYAIKHKDESIVAASRSGGVFTALSDKILLDNGVVYGCVLNEKFEAIHVRADNVSERDHMRGSKYIQSRLGDTFKDVEQDLNANKKVLFSGTPCQVAGLKQFLGKKYPNLICVDVVCHGAPSGKVWNKYLLWHESRENAKIVDADFRNKKDFGWRAHVETLKFDNGQYVSSEIFKNLFYRHTILRPSCYECPYKSVIRSGDISIADYWKIEVAAPEFDDDKGVSLVLVNNEKGEEYLNCVKDNLIIKKTNIEDSMQQSLKAPYPKPLNREQFWSDFSSKPFSYITEKYGM